MNEYQKFLDDPLAPSSDEIELIARKAAAFDWLAKHCARELQWILWLRRKIADAKEIRYLLNREPGKW